MRVLVTASSGQLGTEICRQLLEAGHQASGLDPRPGPFTTRLGSVEDRALVFQLVGKADAVIHAASLHAPHRTEVPASGFVDVNVHGALNVLEAAAEARPQRRVVYTSTTSIYGFALVPEDRAVWVTEDLRPRPRDIYDVTKQAAEALCEMVHRERGLPVLVLRTSRFFPEPPEVMAYHRSYRGVDVRDAAAAHLLALDSPLRWGVYNISSRSPLRSDDLKALLERAGEVVRQRSPRGSELYASRGWTFPPRIDRVYVIDRAERELGYRPRFNFEEHLAGG